MLTYIFFANDHKNIAVYAPKMELGGCSFCGVCKAERHLGVMCKQLSVAKT